MKHIFILFVIFISFLNSVEAQTFDWAISMSGSVDGRAIKTDNSGNCYVTGYFSGTATFGTTQITSYGEFDIFIAKYDANGNFQWVQKAGGTDYDIGLGISIDSSGNCYVTGHFYGTATFGTTQITSYGGEDIFIAKYDANGNFQWVQKAGGASNERGFGISADNSGNCYVTGYFTGTATFGTTQITSYGGDDIFIAKYDTNGNLQWVQKAGGTDYDYGLDISTDNSGNYYVTGYFRDMATFGTTQISSSGEYDIFIAKYDTNGNFQWVQKAGGINSDYVCGISTDNSGNCYVTGYFTGTATFGTTQITSYGGDDIFIAKYDANGNFQWVQKAGGTSNEIGFGISADNSGNCYVTGYFTGTATFGTTQITSYGGDDIFIAKYDANGNFQWVQKVGGIDSDYGYDISTDNEGNCYVTGSYYYATFGNIILNSSGGFITKLVPTTLEITSPAGGEVWQHFSVHNITWNSQDDGNIKIEITTNNGTNWLVLQDNVQASTGNFTYTVTPFPTSNQCRIRLTSLSYGNVSTSELFTITSESVPNLEVTSPNTAVKWNAGSNQNVTWISTGGIDNVKLEYTTNNGNNWITIVSSTPSANQSYSWSVPNTPSTRCRVRVSDINNAAFNDVSDELFTIAHINVTAPVEGNKWRAQTQQKIKWNSTGVANLRLYYSTNNGTNWNTIISSVSASTGEYNWTLPNVESENCRIKLEDASDNTLLSISDVFWIWKPLVSTQTPSVGQVVLTFNSTNITFSGFIIVSSPITVTYYPYESPQTGALPSGVSVVSQYYWTITSPSISFMDGAMSVPLSALSGVNDPSKLIWLKRVNAGDPWINIGGIISDSILVSTVLFNSFSEIAIGSTDYSNPLPVELSLFKGSVFGNEVVLHWITETELNNYGFEIQRKEGPEFIVLDFVEGSGNSTTRKEYRYKDEKLLPGKYFYRLRQIDFNGSYTFSHEIEINIGSIPSVYGLEQNYPNPFNPNTTLKYSLPFDSEVKIVIYDIIGQKVKSLVNAEQSAGYYEISFNSNGLSSGIYFYVMEADQKSGGEHFRKTLKMILMK